MVAGTGFAGQDLPFTEDAVNSNLTENYQNLL